MKLQKIRLACRVTDEILAEVVGNLRRGKSEIEVAREIRNLTKKKADGLAFQPVVAFGRNAAEPHHKPAKRRLKIGDIVKIDLGVKVSGFCSDLTRTFFTSKPTEFQRLAYSAVLAAQKLGIRKVRVGVSGKDLDAYARNFLERQKLARYFIHSLGHGLGKKIHQAPKIGPKSRSILKVGDAITIEPGVYFKRRLARRSQKGEGGFGIRIEDTLIVKKNGAEILTKSPKRLKILKI